MLDKADFNGFYREFYPRVFSLCRRMLNSVPLAEEASQETFMRVFKNLHTYQSDRAVWPWISSIASNHCIDLLRKNKNIPDFSELDTDTMEAAEPVLSSLNTLIREQNAKVLNQAIDELPEKFRLPLVMAFFNDASYDEIAETLSISRNHVGVLILRGKKQLRGKMDQAAMQHMSNEDN